MDNLGKNWQLINILFCGYRRKLEIADPPQMCAETYTRPDTGAPASNKHKLLKLRLHLHNLCLSIIVGYDFSSYIGYTFQIGR
jgi:hypothetical protein